MKCKRLLMSILATSAIAVVTVGPAFARDKHKNQPRCVPNKPYEFSWSFLLPGHPAPEPNGCAPPVYSYGKYIGQDPDLNIRFQMYRDPTTGYYAYP
ncbi:MAG: hypothetical protein WCF47_11600 [Pseudolabrys sp.]